MWKDYSLSYIRKNRASSFSVLAAALIAAAFLSLLFSLMYSMWDYERTRIVAEEGDYHARLREGSMKRSWSSSGDGRTWKAPWSESRERRGKIPSLTSG